MTNIPSNLRDGQIGLLFANLNDMFENLMKVVREFDIDADMTKYSDIFAGIIDTYNK